MPLKRSKKTSKKAINEDSFPRRFRIREEKETKEAKAKIKAAEEAKKEEAHKHKVIYKYVSGLDTKLDEMGMKRFWVWLDKPGFKKIVMEFKDMQKKLHKNPEKYKGRHLADFVIKTRHDRHGIKDTFGSADAWMMIDMTIRKIDDNGDINGRHKPWGCDWRWESNDFKITKFSFKFLAKMAKIFEKHKLNYPSIGGIELRLIMETLASKKIKFGDVLQPLANI